MRKRRFFLNVVIIILVAASAFSGGYYLKKAKDDEAMRITIEAHKTEVLALGAQIPEKEKGYVLNKDMKSDSLIKEGDVILVEYDKQLMPTTAVRSKEDVLGKRLKTNGSLYTLMTLDMIYDNSDIEDDIREQQFSFIQLPDKLDQGDVIDVRIHFPTGQDYVLLSKKKVLDIERATDINSAQLKQIIWTDLSESEIVRMGSAVVDAYLSEAQLYAIEYMAPYVQEAAEVNYPENANVLSLIEKDQGIIDQASFSLELSLRKDLEEALITYAKEDDERLPLPTEEIVVDETEPGEDVSGKSNNTSSDNTSNDTQDNKDTTQGSSAFN